MLKLHANWFCENCYRVEKVEAQPFSTFSTFDLTCSGCLQNFPGMVSQEFYRSLKADR